MTNCPPPHSFKVRAAWVVAALLSLSRLVAAFLLPGLLLGAKADWPFGLALVAWAGFSDFADGAVARRFGAESPLGAALDPIADKAFCLVAFWVLMRAGLMPWGLWGAMIARDLLIVAGYSLLHLKKRTPQPKPIWSGKVYTAVQLLALALVFLQQAFWPLWPGAWILQALLWGALWVMLVWSLYGYVMQGYRLWKAPPENA